MRIDFMENGIGFRGPDDEITPPIGYKLEPVRIAGVLVYVRPQIISLLKTVVMDALLEPKPEEPKDGAAAGPGTGGAAA